MPHIHTEPGQHDLTASAFIVRTDFDEPKIMLHWHKKLKKYLQFGGHVELDETPWQAIAHELREESGYDLAQLKVLQPRERLMAITGSILHPVPVAMNTHPFTATDYKHSHTDIEYGFVASGQPQNQPEEGESVQFECFSAGELKALGQDEIIENVREISLYLLEVCFVTWERVDPAEFSL